MTLKRLQCGKMKCVLNISKMVFGGAVVTLLLFITTGFNRSQFTNRSHWANPVSSELGKRFETARDFSNHGRSLPAVSSRIRLRANRNKTSAINSFRGNQQELTSKNDISNSLQFHEDVEQSLMESFSYDGTPVNKETGNILPAFRTGGSRLTKDGMSRNINPTTAAENDNDWRLSVVLRDEPPIENCYGIIKTGQNYIVLYNAVPKTGSRSLFRILQDSLNSSETTRHVPIMKINRSNRSDENSFLSFIEKVRAPLIIRGHVPFRNLPSNFLYINMVRDPLERFVSEYYFLRNGDSLIPARSAQLSHGYKPNQLPEGWNDTLDECVRKKSELCYPNSGIMKLFCGFSPSCSVASRWTFNHAVFNLDRYTVVGLTDDFASTLEALEKLLPDLVAKDTAAIIRKRYNLSKYQTLNRNDPKEETKTILRTQMAHEHEFYNLVRQKFRKLKTELGIA